MVTKSEVIKYLTKHSDRLNIYLNDDKIYDKSGYLICDIDEYVKKLRIKLGCSFKSIFYSHAFLENVLECNKCGTVIFTKEDEEYDPNLTCPTCTGYETYFKYYTKAQIESDENVKNTIQSYIDMQKFQDEAYQYEKEHGHPYWEICRKKIYTKKKMYEIELKCRDIRKSWFKGLRLEISKFSKNSNKKSSYSFRKRIFIPLSFSGIYVHWIYPHLGKCHKDFRSKWFIGKPKEKGD